MHRFYRCASNQLANVAGDTFRHMLARRDRCCYALREFNNDNININNNDNYNKHAHAGQLNRSTYLRALLLVLHNRGNLVFWAQCPSQLASRMGGSVRRLTTATPCASSSSYSQARLTRIYWKNYQNYAPSKRPNDATSCPYTYLHFHSPQSSRPTNIFIPVPPLNIP